MWLKLETSGKSIIDSRTHAVTDFCFRLFKKTRWWTEPKMEFIKLLDHTHHKDSLDSREEKTKNLKFKLFVESKYKKQIFPNPNFSLVRRFSVLEILIMQNLALKTTLSQYFPLCNKLLRYYKIVFFISISNWFSPKKSKTVQDSYLKIFVGS